MPKITPVAMFKLFSLIVLCLLVVPTAVAQDRQTHEAPWITVTHPATAAPGEQVTLGIDVPAEAAERDLQLRVDTHWFRGRERVTRGPRRGPMRVVAGEGLQQDVRTPIPDQPGISAVQYVIYMGPTGGWADKTHHTEVGFRVHASAPAAGGNANPPAAAEPEPASPPQAAEPARPQQDPLPPRPDRVDAASPVQPWFEAEHPAAWRDRELPAWESSVPADIVTIDGHTDIPWSPLPFEFTPGDSVRYIDFADGDDANTGQSPDQAWQHHPWDDNAQGNAADAEGIHTYVFKRGVVYRGSLTADDSGQPDNPVRLTSDPDWGDGEAVISGSDHVADGWSRVAEDQLESLGFPADVAGNLWAAEIGDTRPWALWIAADENDADADRRRLPIARWPNWQIEHPYNHFTQWHRVQRADPVQFPRTNIYAPDVLNDPDPQAYRHATIWIDHANTSGEFSIIGPFPSRVGSYDPDTGRLQPHITHPARHPRANAPFFLENLPRFLDEAGEWYYSPRGDDAGTLYVWLPEGGDPSDAGVEIAQRMVLLDIDNQSHIDVSGLTLTGGNARDLNDAPRAGDWERPQNDTQMVAIRLANNAQHIDLHHLRIVDTAGAGITNLVTEQDTSLSDITVRDSEFTNIDDSGIRFISTSAPIRNPHAEVTRIDVLRNRLTDIGFRASTDQGGRGMDFNGIAVGEIAGNVAERIAAQGINVVGGRFGTDMPLIRILIHRNRVHDTLIYKTDFGGIEFWGMGPAYVYNNISSNPVGFVAHRGVYHKNQAYYFDHGAKGYLFNNIGWSDSREDAYRGILGDYFFHEIRNRWNQAFHNTAYNFRSGQTHSIQHGDQQHYLANIFINTFSGATSHWRLDEAEEIAYGHNLFHGQMRAIYDRWRGETFYTIDAFREDNVGNGNLLTAHLGWGTDDMPVRDPEGRDFRPTDDSAAIDRGIRMFVPWALAGTVGEWHFRHQPRDPNTVLDYDVFAQRFLRHHEDLRSATRVPGNILTGEGFTADHYVPGPLEDWVPGALAFDGQRHMSLPHARLVRDFELRPNRRNQEPEMVDGATRQTVSMSDNNFLIEAVLRVEQGNTGTIAGKLGGDAGYALTINDDGRVVLQVRADAQDATLASDAVVADGRWHHVIAEVDRADGRMAIYINGELSNGSSTGEIPASDVSLANEVDFVVGENFTGALEYLRVCRGTLADSETTIDELMAWQFNGPASHDFVDRPVTGERRDIGAIEHPTASGLQPIAYTPIEPPEGEATAGGGNNAGGGDADTFRTGEGRTVRTFDWGAVSVPDRVAPGGELDVQVTFGTESIPRQMRLHMDLHGVINGQRRPGIGRARPIQVTPGVTSPYSSVLTVRPREGLERVMVVIYVTPDGTYGNRTISTELGVPVGR